MANIPKKRRKLNQPSPPRRVQELNLAVHHLRYEREALDFAGTRLTQEPHPTGLQYAVLMDSFLVHARNLNEFFYGWEMACEGKKPPFLDDVIAEDFSMPKCRGQNPSRIDYPMIYASE